MKYPNLKWKEINGKKIRTYQLDEEPYVMYFIPTVIDEYLIVKNDAFGQDTGKTEILKRDEIKEKYRIDLTE